MSTGSASALYNFYVPAVLCLILRSQHARGFLCTNLQIPMVACHQCHALWNRWAVGDQAKAPVRYISKSRGHCWGACSDVHKNCNCNLNYINIVYISILSIYQYCTIKFLL